MTITKKTRLLAKPAVITCIKSNLADAGVIYPAEAINILGSNLKIPEGQGVGWSSDDPAYPSGEFPPTAFFSNTDTALCLDYMWEGGRSLPHFANGTTLTFNVKGTTGSAVYTYNW